MILSVYRINMSRLYEYTKPKSLELHKQHVMFLQALIKWYEKKNIRNFVRLVPVASTKKLPIGIVLGLAFIIRGEITKKYERLVQGLIREKIIYKA